MNSVTVKIFVCLSIMTLATVSTGSTPVTENMSSGPEKGWLVLHGGGTKREYGAMHRFVDLSGGAKANIIVVLTPIELEILTPEFKAQYKSWWASELGAENVTFLDTRDRQEANTDAFVAPLRKATGVWIMGGRMSYLLKYYLGTKTEQEIKAVVERGGVLAGSSAGAMIQSSFLVSRTNTDSGGVKLAKGIFLDTTQLVGFGLLKDVAVDPHFFARREEDQMVRLIEHYPQLLGIGIDEGAAIVVHNDQLEVINQPRVGIFDGQNHNGKKYLILHQGQRYDLKQRKPIK